MNRLLKIGFAVVLVSFFVGGCDKTAPAQNAPAAQTAEEPGYGLKEAPAFTLANHDGKMHRPADYKGKIIVLEWVNPECPFVVRHYNAKTMVDLAKAYADKDVIWLAVNTTSHFNPSKNKEFADQYTIHYPVLDDSAGTVGRLYDAKTTPHLFIIGKDGRIAYNGAIDDDPQGTKTVKTNYVKAALDELLAGKAVTTAETKPYGCSVKYAQ